MLRLLPLLLVAVAAPAAALSATLPLMGARVDVEVQAPLAPPIEADLPAVAAIARDVLSVDAGALLPLDAIVDPDTIPALDALPTPDEAPATPPPFAQPAPEIAQAAAGASLLWLLLERLGLGRALVGAFAALYFRVQPSELLENERREHVVQLVRERPGIGPTEIASALGTGWGVTSYHLDRLERAGLVTSHRYGQHRCYFVPGAVRREEQPTVGLFRGDTTRRVAELVAQRPGLTQTELCRALGLSASAASKQVAKLVGAGVLRREASAQGQRLFAAA